MGLIKIDWEPGARRIKQFGLGLLGFSALLAFMSWRKGATPSAAVLLAGLGMLTLALPRAGRRIYQGWMALVYPIGACVSVLLLALLYFGVITPIGLALRIFGRDALQLRPLSAGESGWAELKLSSDPKHYERLF
ncbi:MAG: SxtJ family membrane protein [Elusimicrobiota bacterium]|jgi:hypothetical protein